MPLEFQPALATATPNISVSKRLSLPRRTKVSVRERMSFTEQLALLLETGMPLHVALQALQRQAENPAMRRIIAGLISDVEAGQRFSHALGQYPELFSTIMIKDIKFMSQVWLVT